MHLAQFLILLEKYENQNINGGLYNGNLINFLPPKGS